MYRYHVKLASNFQTIEFDCNRLEDEIVMDGIELIKFLGKQVDSSVQTPVKEKEEEVKEEEVVLATDKQIAFLKELGINAPPTLTKNEAWKMINEKTRKNS